MPSIMTTKNKNVSAVYDRIYDIADRLFKKYNPCNHRVKNSIVLCNGKNVEQAKEAQQDNIFLCCGLCEHNSPTGCTVKCLSCKLYLCPTLHKDYPLLSKRLYKLRHITAKYGMYGCFKTKDEILSLSKQRIKNKDRKQY